MTFLSDLRLPRHVAPHMVGRVSIELACPMT